MKYVTSSRRQVVMAFLLALAVVGAAMRYWAPDPSVARDIGTLLLVLWLPTVGNLVGFGIRQWHARRSRRMDFDAARAFSPQLVVRVTHVDVPAGPGATTAKHPSHCTIAIGNQGFTARASAPLAQLLSESSAPLELPLELLRPDLALARLSPGTEFQLFAGNVPMARGTVLRPCS